jgi:hypothetical protein
LIEVLSGILNVFSKKNFPKKRNKGSDALGDADPDQQLQHFNNIVKWLLELHAPLQKLIKKDDLNPFKPSKPLI